MALDLGVRTGGDARGRGRVSTSPAPWFRPFRTGRGGGGLRGPGRGRCPLARDRGRRVGGPVVHRRRHDRVAPPAGQSDRSGHPPHRDHVVHPRLRARRDPRRDLGDVRVRIHHERVRGVHPARLSVRPILFADREAGVLGGRRGDSHPGHRPTLPARFGVGLLDRDGTERAQLRLRLPEPVRAVPRRPAVRRRDARESPRHRPRHRSWS